MIRFINDGTKPRSKREWKTYKGADKVAKTLDIKGYTAHAMLTETGTWCIKLYIKPVQFTREQAIKMLLGR